MNAEPSQTTVVPEVVRSVPDTAILGLIEVRFGLLKLAEESDEPTGVRLIALANTLDRVAADLRSGRFGVSDHTRSERLHSQILDIARNAEISLGFLADVDIDGPIERLDDDSARLLLDMMWASLAQLARHAAATSVHVWVSVGDELGLTVTDNGLRRRDVFELTQRAREAGGTYEVTPSLAGGSQSVFRMPLP